MRHNNYKNKQPVTLSGFEPPTYLLGEQ